MKIIQQYAIIILTLCVIFISCKKENGQTQNMSTTAHIGNPQTNLDLSGTYTGFIPCADCIGISVRIALNCDNTYDLQYRYVGKSDKYLSFSGKYIWNEISNTITLDCEDFPKYYSVKENKLMQLDMNGNKIEGEFAAKYILQKTE